MKLNLRLLVPAAGLLALILWLAVPRLSDADKNGSPLEQFGDLGIISQSGIAPSANLVLEDINGRRSSIADFKGKIVLLNLWATWCPECAREMPALEKLQNQLGSDDFAVVAIDLREAREDVAEFARANRLTFKILLDQEGQLGQAFNIRSIPTTYILGRNGELLGKVVGARDWDGRDFTTLFRDLIRVGQPLAVGAAAKPATGAKQGIEVSEKTDPLPR